jgi:multidrug resistance efflux pump
VRLAADDLANARLAAEAVKRVRDAQGDHARASRALHLAEQRTKLAEQQAGLEQARFALAAATLRQEASRAAVADPFVRATKEGVVLDLPVHAGDRLAAGALVARLASLDPLIVDVDVPPITVNQLKVGDAALVEIPAVAAAALDARIRSIAPLPGDDGSYNVRLTLPNPGKARLAGLAAHVRLAVRVRADAR